MGGTAIVFVHRGWSPYLAIALRQAVAVGGAPVWLISDSARYATIPGVRHASPAGLDSRAGTFADLYQHLSANPPGFELFCWQRWFLVEALARREGLAGVVHLDSDVLLYAAAAGLAADGAREGLALCLTQQDPVDLDGPLMGSASGHCSWWSRGALAEFCDFAESAYRPGPLLERFRAKWERHRVHHLGGGVCDMTGLIAFSRSRAGGCANLLPPGPDGVVDDNLHRADNHLRREYRVSLGLKTVRFHAGRPYLVRHPDGVEVAARALHFQGDAKPLMRSFASVRGEGRLLPARIAAWQVAARCNRAFHRLVLGGPHGRAMRAIWRRLRRRAPAG